MPSIPRLEKIIFLILIFSIPFQKRIFLFGPGHPVESPEKFFEWSSGFLYFTDILILVLIALWSILHFAKPKLLWSKCRGLNPRHFALGLLLLTALISTTQAELMGVSAYRFIKLGEFVLLFFFVVDRAKSIGLRNILGIFVASGVFQAIIAIAQFARQSSLGLSIFHESTLAIGMKGVANFGGGDALQMIRAYGTFPSPNVLAGFLGICLFFAFYLFVSRRTGAPASLRRRTNAELTRRNFVEAAIVSATVFVLSLGLLLTFSRGVILFFVFTSALFFGGIFIFKKLRHYRKSAMHLLALVGVSWLVIVTLMWPELSTRFFESSASEPAIQERLFFNSVGIDTATHDYAKLFFGVGIGNFVNYYMGYLPGLASYLYQPVHNVFILIASEIGMIGLIAFILFLSLLIGRGVRNVLPSDNLILYTLLCVSGFMLLVAMYDHYFWTLQQGSLMFWVVLGLLANASKK